MAIPHEHDNPPTHTHTHDTWYCTLPIAGIISRLYYLNELNVGAIWLSPFYTSPMRDFGYDISNYTDVDPTFGTMDDFDKLIKEAHNKGRIYHVDIDLNIRCPSIRSPRTYISARCDKWPMVEQYTISRYNNNT